MLCLIQAEVEFSCDTTSLFGYWDALPLVYHSFENQMLSLYLLYAERMPVMNDWYAIESSMMQLNQTIVHPHRFDAMSNLLQLQRSNTTTQHAQCTLYHAWFTPLTTWWKCIRDSAVQSRKRPAGGSLSQNGRFFDSGSFFRRAGSNPRMMNHGSLHPVRCGLNPKCQFLNSS